MAKSLDHVLEIYHSLKILQNTIQRLRLWKKICLSFAQKIQLEFLDGDRYCIIRTKEEFAFIQVNQLLGHAMAASRNMQRMIRIYDAWRSVRCVIEKSMSQKKINHFYARRI